MPKKETNIFKGKYGKYYRVSQHTVNHLKRIGYNINYPESKLLNQRKCKNNTKKR